MKRVAFWAALFALVTFNADGQQSKAPSYIQVSPTPSELSVGGPGLVAIDQQGRAFIQTSTPGSGTVTNALNLGNNQMVVGDGGTTGVKTVSGGIGGSFTTTGNFAYTGAAGGLTLNFPVGGPFAYDWPAAGTGTLLSADSLATVTGKTINCANNTCVVRANADLTGIVPGGSGGTGIANGGKTLTLGAAATSLPAAPGTTQCLHMASTGDITPSGADCGTGSGTGNLVVGTSTVTSGTNTRVLFDQAGILGEYVISGSGSVAMTNSPVLVTPNIGTPSTAVLTFGTGLPLSTGVTGNLPVGNLGGGTGASSTTCWYGDASWKNCGSLRVGVTPIAAGTNTSIPFDNAGLLGEYTVSGTGSVAMTNSPVLLTPDLGTPSAVNLVNGLSLPITGVATFNSAAFFGRVTDETGSGFVVGSASPTFTGVPLAPTASPGTNTTQLATTAFVQAASASTPVTFVGNTAGSANTYTIATPTPNSFTLTDQFVVCGTISATNTGASTLNVASTGARAIDRQTGTGLSALTGGEMIASNTQYCWQYNAAATAWVLLTNLASGVTKDSTPHTVTQNEWTNWQVFDYTANGTLTLPVATSLAPNGGIVIKTEPNVVVTLTPNAADGINGGTINTSITLPGSLFTIVTTTGASGVNAFQVPRGSVTPLALTWAPGINPNNLPIANISEGKIIVGIRCTPEVLAGGAATIQPVKAASATAISAGTNLTSNTCNANSGAATDQDLTLSVTTLAAGDRLGIKTTGTTVWTSSGVAAGVLTVFVR